MRDTELHKSYPGGEAPYPRMYSPDLQPLLQSLLATLADIDFAYECEREKLSESTPDVNFKIKVLERLKAQHREKREPYIRQLAILQKNAFELRSL